MMIQVGVVFGITAMQSVQQSRLGAVGLEASYHWGYATGAVLALVAVATATRIANATTAAGDPQAPDVPGEPLAAV